MQDHSHAPRPAGISALNHVEARDPVCGMTVDPARATGSLEFAGATWYFCSPSCLEKFRSAPEKYSGLDPARPTQTAEVTSAEGLKYTCPMHPEVVQNGPGACPICGMALEPVMVSAEFQKNPELIDMERRFWVSVVLTTPILAGAMLEMIAGAPLAHFFSRDIWVWIQFILATPAVLWCGWPFFERAWASVVHRSPNMFTLIALGTGTAYVYSVVATLVPGIFPASFRGHAGTIEIGRAHV